MLVQISPMRCGTTLAAKSRGSDCGCSGNPVKSSNPVAFVTRLSDPLAASLVTTLTETDAVLFIRDMGPSTRNVQ